MSDGSQAPHSFVREHLAAVRRSPRAAIGLAIFCVAMGIGIWFGTVPLDSVGLRIFCVVLGAVTMAVCGIGYLFPGEDEA